MPRDQARWAKKVARARNTTFSGLVSELIEEKRHHEEALRAFEDYFGRKGSVTTEEAEALRKHEEDQEDNTRADPGVHSDDLAHFCRRIEERSREHHDAMFEANRRGWRSIAIGILRQELDSMVRVIYLLSTQDRVARTKLVQAAIRGEKWRTPTAKGKLQNVADKHMVDLAQTLNGWTRSVYRFGCGFIHLSDFHDYHARDPFQALPSEERESIAYHLRTYHGGCASPDSSFEEIARYIPRFLDKISGNLRCYLEKLRQDGDLDDG